MTPAKSRQTPPRTYSHHGLTTLRTALDVAGKRLQSRRYKLGRALWQWRSELVADLGGAEAISTQQATVIDLAVKTKLLLDSIDAWLLQQPTLINKRKRAVLPVVRERQQLADALARYMAQLGLERKAKPTKDLTSYLREKYAHQPSAAPPEMNPGVPDAAPSPDSTEAS
jgi:hypothetical protein